MLARLQKWLDRVADWVGGEGARKAYWAEQFIGPHEVRGPTLTFANGKSITLETDIVRTHQIASNRLMILTAKPAPGAVRQQNLFCVDGRADPHWASPDGTARGHYTDMKVETDRLALATDAGWHVELGLRRGQVLNEWMVEDGPRYRVSGSILTFTNGRSEDFGSPILETIDAGPVVVVMTESGPPDSPGENIAAVDESRFVWRIPKHRWARDEKRRPMTYRNIGFYEGHVTAVGCHFTLFCDPATGAILQEFQWR